ncbi:MAG TPA: PqqD family protein [Trueperaceae bacterium]
MATKFGHWRIHAGVHVAVDGESLLLLSPKGEYFGLDDTAAEIWRALEQGRLEEVASKLSNNAAVPLETVCTDIRNFLTDLNGAGLLEKQP